MFHCEACGVELPEARREAHLAHWCAALPASSDDSDDGGSTPAAAPAPAAFLQDSASTRALRVAVPALGCTFQFEQLSIFGELSTGGALWYSEVVTAEWIARRLSAERAHRTRARGSARGSARRSVRGSARTRARACIRIINEFPLHVTRGSTYDS